MGKYAVSIMGHELVVGDWEFDYVKQKQSFEYYQKYKINAELDDKDIEIPFLDLGFVLRKNIKTYSWEWPEGSVFHSWLYKQLREKGKIMEFICLNVYLFSSHQEVKVSDYYLQSEIGDDDIRIGVTPQKHEIKKYEDYKWLRDRLLYACEK